MLKRPDKQLPGDLEIGIACLAGSIFGAFVYEVFFRLSRDEVCCCSSPHGLVAPNCAHCLGHLSSRRHCLCAQQSGVLLSRSPFQKQCM